MATPRKRTRAAAKRNPDVNWSRGWNRGQNAGRFDLDIGQRRSAPPGASAEYRAGWEAGYADVFERNAARASRAVFASRGMDAANAARKASPKRNPEPKVYWLLTAWDGHSSGGSDSLVGTADDARDRAYRLADATGQKVEVFKGGGTKRSFVIQPAKKSNPRGKAKRNPAPAHPPYDMNAAVQKALLEARQWKENKERETASLLRRDAHSLRNPRGKAKRNPAYAGRLFDYKTGADCGPATAAQVRASKVAAKRDGGAGVIVVNMRSVWAEDSPSKARETYPRSRPAKRNPAKTWAHDPGDNVWSHIGSRAAAVRDPDGTYTALCVNGWVEGGIPTLAKAKAKALTSPRNRSRRSR